MCFVALFPGVDREALHISPNQAVCHTVPPLFNVRTKDERNHFIQIHSSRVHLILPVEVFQ
jgi:hypothetical protein